MTLRMKNIDVALIYELWNEYAAAINAGDLERWMSLWLDDGIQMAPNEPTHVGLDQIRTAVQPTFDLFFMTNAVFNTEEVRILGNWAYSYGAYTFEKIPKQGGKTTSSRCKFLDILVKLADGSWKIAIDCHNYDKSPDKIHAAFEPACSRRNKGSRTDSDS